MSCSIRSSELLSRLAVAGLLAVACGAPARSQSYTIQTVAGGGIPNNVSALQVPARLRF